MGARLSRITITLDEDAARWTRLEAARQGKSVSRLLSRILQEKMADQHIHLVAECEYERAMRRALARKPFLKTNGSYSAS